MQHTGHSYTRTVAQIRNAVGLSKGPYWRSSDNLPSGYLVSKYAGHSELCTSIYTPTMKELDNNVTLLNFVRTATLTAHSKQVTSHLRAELGIDLDSSGYSKQTLYRLLRRVREKIQGDPFESYKPIPSFLESFSTRDVVHAVMPQGGPTGL
jgi:hypothetical protein